MSNPYDQPGGSDGSHRNPPPNHDQGAYGSVEGQSYDSQGFGPQPYGSQSYDSQPYGSQPYGQQDPYGQSSVPGPQDPPYGQSAAPGPQDPPYGQPSQSQPAPYGSNPYGANPYGNNPYGAAPPLKTNGLAVASLVTSLGALLGFFCGFLALAAPVGLVLGIVARKQVHDNPTTQTGEGLALGGIIAGAILSFLMAIFLVLYIAFFGWSVLAAPTY